MYARASLRAVSSALLLTGSAAGAGLAQLPPLPHLPHVPRPQGQQPPQTPHPTPSQATNPTLNAKVTETLMGPRTPRVSMSADGEHLAIVTPKGSREVVLLDGVEGPLFDEIPRALPGQGSLEVQWSPTGGRSAYVGRRGGDFIAVIDGKEAGVIATSAGMSGMPYGAGGAWKFWFSDDGSRLAYAVSASPTTWVMMVDGARTTPYPQLDLKQTVLKGKRLIYVAQTPDNKWHLVADGKPGPGYDQITSLLVSPDGAHYAFLANRPGGNLVVADGVEGKLFPQRISDLDLAPDGRVAYMATQPTAPGPSHPTGPDLIVGGLTVSNSQTFGLTPAGGYSNPNNHVAWSPDGKRFAYVGSNRPNPGVTVMVNGKAMGLTYQSANELSFSPDGSRFAYQSQGANMLMFPVIDGQEGQGTNRISDFVWSPDGKRYAYQEFGQASGGGIKLVVDGKEQPPARSFTRASWSPDGRHVSYAASFDGMNFQAVVDGAPRPGRLLTFQPRVRADQPLTFPQLAWSPDGNHLAYVALRTDGPGGALFVDAATYPGPTAFFSFPSWSPDSKHFAAMTWMNPQGWSVMIDGKLSPFYSDMLETSVGGCRFVAPNTFRFYGIKGGQIYRVRIDI